MPITHLGNIPECLLQNQWKSNALKIGYALQLLSLKFDEICFESLQSDSFYLYQLLWN